MPIDHINIEAFRNAQEFGAVGIDGGDVVSIKGSTPDKGGVRWIKNLGTYGLNIKKALTDARDAKVSTINKNINAIEAFKQSLVKTYGKHVSAEAAKPLKDLDLSKEPLTGRMVKQVLDNVEKAKTALVKDHIDALCYDSDGDVSGEFKHYCSNYLESKGWGPSSLSGVEFYEGIITSLKEHLQANVKAEPGIEDKISDIAEDALDGILEKMGQEVPFNRLDYIHTLKTSQGLTPKFDQMFEKAVGSSPYGHLIDEKARAGIVSSIEYSFRKYVPEEFSTGDLTPKQKYERMDAIVQGEIRKRLDAVTKLETFKSASPEIQAFVEKNKGLPGKLEAALDRAHAERGTVTKSECLEIFESYLAEENASKAETSTRIDHMCVMKGAYDDLLATDPTLEDFPCTVNKPMVEKLAGPIIEHVKQSEQSHQRALTDEDLCELAKTPIRKGLTEIMNSPNMTTLVSLTGGTEGKGPVRDLCVGLLGARLLSETIPREDIEAVVREAEKTVEGIMGKMTGEVGRLATALKTPGDTGPIFECIKSIQKHYVELPEGLDSHDKFVVYNSLLDKALGELDSRDVEALRTADIDCRDLGKQMLKQARKEGDEGTVFELGRNAFHAERGGLAGHGVAFRDLESPRLPSLSRLMISVGKQYVDGEILKTTARHLDGDPTVLGKGQFNTVFRGSYDNGTYQGVFKPVAWGGGTTSVPGQGIGIDQVNPNYHVRNVVSRDLERDLLGSGQLPGCRYARQGGKEGILMDFRPGTDRTQLDPTNPTLRREMIKLGFLDAFMGQIDRHGDNFTIQLDGNGGILGVTGIDNDLCLGGEKPEMDPNTGRIIYPGEPTGLDEHPQPKGVFATPYLPPVIERKDYDKYMAIKPADIDRVVKGRLSAKETEALKARVECIQGHLNVLEGSGRVLDADAPDFDTKFKQAYEEHANRFNCYLETPEIRATFE